MSTHTHSIGRPSSSITVIGGCLLMALVSATGTVHAQDDSSGSNVITPPADITMMSVGDGTTCVALQDGTAKCWGRNSDGQLGRGDTIAIGDDEVPADVESIDLGGFVEEIHTNGEQTFARLASGEIRGWGLNDAYQLGLQHNETIGDDETLAQTNTTVDLDGPAIDLAVGDGFACAVLAGGKVQCWGANDVGQLGLGHTQKVGDDESPASAGYVPLGGNAVSVIAGTSHACALLDDGSVECWGLNADGQLGLGHTQAIGDDEVPLVEGPLVLGGDVEQLAAGERHTCALMANGDVRCWGSNDSGQLGSGSPETIGDDELPAERAPVSLARPAIDIAAGARHTCAILDDWSMVCWGDGQEGRLGLGHEGDVGLVSVPLTAGVVTFADQRAATMVFVGSTAESTCAQLDDGALQCWGLNDVGQLGRGHTGSTASTTPGRHVDDIKVKKTND